MLILPGWNSVEGASVYAKIFTFAGWASLFLLGIFEILAHVYGTRKDTLTSIREQTAKQANDQRIASLTAELTQKEKTLDQNISSFNAQLQTANQQSMEAKQSQKLLAEQLSASTKELNSLRERQAPRELSQGQKDNLIAFLLHFSRPTNVEVAFVIGVEDGPTLSRDFIWVFNAAGWHVSPESPSAALFSGDMVGLAIKVKSRDDPAAGPAGGLQQGLKQIGFEAPGYFDDKLQSGTVHLDIGRRP